MRTNELEAAELEGVAAPPPPAPGSTLVPSGSVSAEQLAAWRLTDEEFAAFNAAEFEFGCIPEKEPPPIGAA